MNNKQTVSRKKFLVWGLTIPAFLSIPVFFRREKKKDTTTVKMLTQDGKLVAINLEDIPSKKERIKTKDLQNWINKK